MDETKHYTDLLKARKIFIGLNYSYNHGEI